MQSAKFEVLGIGNAIVDVLTETDDQFLADHAIIKGSMQLIDEAQAEKLYRAMGAGKEVSGGSGANTIAGIASLGGTTAFIGKVRDDSLGEVFTNDIRDIGVSFQTPPATDGPATARCLVLVTPDGERSLNTFLGSSVTLAPGDVDEDLVASAGIVYLEGYLWDPDLAKQAFLKAAKVARAANRQVALTLSDPFCVERHRDSFLELIRNDVDILFANEAEIKSLYQVQDFDEALRAANADCEFALLTRSAAGSVVIDGNDVHEVKAVPVTKVVDTTGAGDLFAAGFLHGFSNGKPLPECAHIGSIAASEIISHIGARPTRPLKDVVAAATGS